MPKAVAGCRDGLFAFQENSAPNPSKDVSSRRNTGKAALPRSIMVSAAPALLDPFQAILDLIQPLVKPVKRLFHP